MTKNTATYTCCAFYLLLYGLLLDIEITGTGQIYEQSNTEFFVGLVEVMHLSECCLVLDTQNMQHNITGKPGDRAD